MVGFTVCASFFRPPRPLPKKKTSHLGVNAEFIQSRVMHDGQMSAYFSRQRLSPQQKKNRFPFTVIQSYTKKKERKKKIRVSSVSLRNVNVTKDVVEGVGVRGGKVFFAAIALWNF